jgi:hypothetical protein
MSHPGAAERRNIYQPDRVSTVSRDSDSPTVVQTHFRIGKYWTPTLVLCSRNARSQGQARPPPDRSTGLRNFLDETKTDAVATEIGVNSFPVPCTKSPMVIRIPRTTAEHVRIFHFFIIPVLTPLPDIPRHVIAPIGADPLGILSRRRRAMIACFPVVAFVLVKLISPGICTPVLASYGLFPLPLCRQAFPRPCRIGFCFVVTDTHDRMIRLVPFGFIPVFQVFENSLVVYDLPLPSFR